MATKDDEGAAEPTARLGDSMVLLRRAQQGDDRALDRLLSRYQERVLRLVRSRMGPRLRRRLESVDLAQHVLITAARCYDRFDVDEEASFIHWLARIAENEVRRQAQFHGAQRRDVARDVRLSEESPGAPPQRDDVVHREKNEQLERALDELTDRQRNLILQRDYLHASWGAIAKDLGYASAEVARVSHSRATLALGKILRRSGGPG